MVLVVPDRIGGCDEKVLSNVQEEYGDSAKRTSKVDGGCEVPRRDNHS
jgi:hypothetical protein